jgi:kynureninase
MDPVVSPVDSADSWQLSNPPILSMAAVLASLEMFDSVGMDALRDRSIRLTAYLEDLLGETCGDRPIEILTPSDPDRRGAQLSVRIKGISAGEVSERLRAEHGVFADARNPDVIRLAPAPMYCTFHDCWRAATALAAVLDA